MYSPIISLSLLKPSFILEVWHCCLYWKISCTALVGDVLFFKLAARWHLEAVIRYLWFKFYPSVSDYPLVFLLSSVISFWLKKSLWFICFAFVRTPFRRGGCTLMRESSKLKCDMSDWNCDPCCCSRGLAIRQSLILSQFCVTTGDLNLVFCQLSIRFPLSYEDIVAKPCVV